jgi:hypothetical protein
MLTFLVIPPEQGKDLDNIALTALPIANEVLRPHIAPHLLFPRHGDEERWLDDALARLKSVTPAASAPTRSSNCRGLLKTRQRGHSASRWGRTPTGAGGYRLPARGDRSFQPARTVRQHVEKRLRRVTPITVLCQITPKEPGHLLGSGANNAPEPRP